MTLLKSVLKLSMPLGVLAAVGLVPLSQDLLCTAAAWAQSTRSYGQAGQAGMNGREGRPGREGGDRTLSADGSSIRLDLAGTDGFASRPSAAWATTPPKPASTGAASFGDSYLR
ncbi:MAG: hypothetical protein KME20_15240 [Kaiparowitsia implicata GSE-PSE-MK54-09C]|jgi:hypothetical protein|nr:hypothetical protein [Kaiparowitsia implicata GSE-PSE-MK54-09C]